MITCVSVTAAKDSTNVASRNRAFDIIFVFEGTKKQISSIEVKRSTRPNAFQARRSFALFRHPFHSSTLVLIALKSHDLM